MDQENMGQKIVSGSKKNKKYIIIAVVVIILLAVALVSNSMLGKRSAERRAERLLESQLGGNVDIDSDGDSVSIKTKEGTFTTGSAAKWPADMPKDIPVITFGELKMASSVSVNGQGWQVSVDKATKADFTTYYSALLTNGWTNVGLVNTSVDFAQMTKGNYDLLLAFNPEDSSFVLTVAVRP
jgi:hypothetical protein